MPVLEAITGPIKNAMQNAFGGQAPEPAFQEDLVAFVDKEFKRRQEEKRIFELQNRLNLAFFEGNQYLDINTASWSLEEQPVLYDWQEREVFNHIRPSIETRISKLKRVRSIFKVKPGDSGDNSDMHAAKIGTMLLRNTYNDRNLRDLESEELAWLETCGTVFRKHVWNPNLGRIVGYSATVNEETGEEEQQEIREGDLEIIIVPPAELFPDNSYRNGISTCKSIIHARAYDIDDIKEIWGVEVGPEKAEAEKMQRAMNGLGGLGYGQGGFMVHTVKLDHHAIVKELWELPTKKNPKGRLVIVGGGKLLHSGKLPYLVGDDSQPGLPFSMIVCLQMPGIFWGKTVLERLIPVQRRYNALRNRKAEYLNRCAIGQWTVQEESVDMDVFESQAGEPGAIHVYMRGALPPQMIQNPALPKDFDTEDQQLLNLFSLLSGVSEISRQSSAPPGVKSGVALSIVQEQDDTRLSNTAENIERARIHSGKIMLRLYKQFVKTPRLLATAGKNNIVEVIDWVGSDIKSEDVILDNMSAMVESPSIKRQMIFDLLESGLLRDPETGQIDREMRSKIFEMIQMGEWESADDDDQLHIAKAERENVSIKQGQGAAAVSYDDHILHISRHNKFRLDADYEELKAEFPVLEQMFEAHVNEHLIFLQQRALAAAAQAAQQQGMMQGGGDSAAQAG